MIGMDSSFNFDPGKCIICQQILIRDDAISRAEGREKIKNAAKIRNDIVNERLKKLDGRDFLYHMNHQCYKVNTKKKNLHMIVESSKELPRENEEAELPMLDETEGPSRKANKV